ncbi:hypothetical protein [Psychroserpens mesophilus]|uniref:hypothetical protein n=1 Tax=Psychroserpens mesophilus TaxID=325473 RepID=UPI003D64BE42
MKKILKLLPIVLLVFAFSCDSDDDSTKFYDEPTTGWVEFATSTSATTVSPVQETLSLPVSLRVPVYENGININYTLVPVEGDFSSIVTTDNVLNFSPNDLPGPDGSARVKSIILNFDNLDTVTDPIVFDVVLSSTDVDGVTIGLDDDSIVSYRVSTPCALNPIVDGTVYIGTSSRGGTVAQDGYPATITDLGNNVYMFDTTWGPSFIDTFAAQDLPNMFFAAVTLAIDPATLEVEILSGGSDGSDNGFGIAYDITGSGTYDTCNDAFILSVATDGIFENGISADVVLQGQ